MISNVAKFLEVCFSQTKSIQYPAYLNLWFRVFSHNWHDITRSELACSLAVLPSPGLMTGSLACRSVSSVPLGGAMLGMMTYRAGPYTSSVAMAQIMTLTRRLNTRIIPGGLQATLKFHPGRRGCRASYWLLEPNYLVTFWLISKWLPQLSCRLTESWRKGWTTLASEKMNTWGS